MFHSKSFKSLDDLKNKIVEFIEFYNAATPFQPLILS
ncbi:hypothetical protein [Clostridium sp. DL1XJH146]